MTAAPKLRAATADVLAFRGDLRLLRNHAVIDRRGWLVLRLQYVSDAEAVRLFRALVSCGALEGRE